jgi:hypothetical protein
MNNEKTKLAIQAELETTRAAFHELLAALSEDDLRRPSHNPGWTNGEILTHMTFGFVVVTVLLPMASLWGRLPKRSSGWFAWLLNASTVPFNWVNALGARAQARLLRRRRHLGAAFDLVLAALLKRTESIRDEEWQRGMHYPVRWDPNFRDFMTLEMIVHYPVAHFNLHLAQIRR